MARKAKEKKANKRSNGDGSLRQRKDGTWEGRYTAGINLANGKPIRKSIYGKDKDDVAARLRKITSDIDSGLYVPPSKMTVKQWYEIWLAEYMGDKKPLTVLQYENMGENHILPGLGAVKLSKLTAPQIQKFYNSLSKDRVTTVVKNGEEKKVNQKALSAKTIRNIHGILSKCLNTAVDQGIMRTNPAERVTVPKVIKAEIAPLTEDQQRAFLKAISGHQYERLFTVILFTGLRESEAIGLTWDCIDFKKGTLKVYRQLQKRKGNYYEFAPLKNDKTRRITLAPFVLSVFRQQYREQAEKKLKAGISWHGFQNEEERKTALVFTTDLGDHLGIATVWREYKKLVEKAGAPEARIHDLRHTFAVNALQNGDDVKTVQENLGHATAAFTLDVYGHVSERMKEESARRQQAFIESLRA